MEQSYLVPIMQHRGCHQGADDVANRRTRTPQTQNEATTAIKPKLSYEATTEIKQNLS